MLILTCVAIYIVGLCIGSYLVGCSPTSTDTELVMVAFWPIVLPPLIVIAVPLMICLFFSSLGDHSRTRYIDGPRDHVSRR